MVLLIVIMGSQQKQFGASYPIYRYVNLLILIFFACKFQISQIIIKGNMVKSNKPFEMFDQFFSCHKDICFASAVHTTTVWTRTVPIVANVHKAYLHTYQITKNKKRVTEPNLIYCKLPTF